MVEEKKMKLTGKFWWQWLWIWHLYKYCNNSQGLRLGDLQEVFIHNNNPQFPSTQYFVTNFENYQSWILGSIQKYTLMLEVPTMGRKPDMPFTFPGSFVLQVCRIYQTPSKTSQWVHSCLYFYHYSVTITSWDSQMLHVFPSHHSTPPHSSGMLCAQHSRPLLTCSSEFFHSPIPVSKLPLWVQVDLRQLLQDLVPIITTTKVDTMKRKS